MKDSNSDPAQDDFAVNRIGEQWGQALGKSARSYRVSEPSPAPAASANVVGGFAVLSVLMVPALLFVCGGLWAGCEAMGWPAGFALVGLVNAIPHRSAGLRVLEVATRAGAGVGWAVWLLS